MIIDPEILSLAIGVGLVVSLLSSELFGLAAGGMIVPGYVALFLDRPMTVVLTLAAALATFMTVRVLSSMIIVYGRRRTVLMILVGYLFGMAFRAAGGAFVGYGDPTYTVIGHIIPGLIAIWMDRQGLVETVSALLTASVIVRLLLILFLSVELIP